MESESFGSPTWIRTSLDSWNEFGLCGPLGFLPILQGTRASNHCKENDDPVHAGRSKSRFQPPLHDSSGRDRRHSVSSGPYTGSTLSRSHARNVLRAFYAPRLPRRAARTISLPIKCGVIRLLFRRLYPRCRSAPFTSLLTHGFGRSESRAEAAALCWWAHLAWAPGIAICGGS
jgi:hypothetical protein